MKDEKWTGQTYMKVEDAMVVTGDAEEGAAEEAAAAEEEAAAEEDAAAMDDDSD